MAHCRSAIVRVCARRAELSGVDVCQLMRAHGVSESALRDREQRLPWSFFVGVLESLEKVLGGPLALEQFGAEVGAAYPLFRLLVALHFGLAEIQQIAAERLLLHLFEGAIQPVVSRQTDGAVRITLSLGREYDPSYPFWTFVLGLWRPLPRLFELDDSYIEVELADRFAEFWVIFPVDSTGEPTVGAEVRKRVRETLLKDLVRNEELFELPTPDPGTSILERRIGAAAAPEPRVVAGLRALEQEIGEKIGVGRLQLFELTQTGLRRVGSMGTPLELARIRRMLWVSGMAVGAVEVERPRAAGHAREASLLDEFIEVFAYRFAELQNRLPLGMASGGFTLADAEVRDPGTGEPPPSSRGRLARAARDGRLRELAAEWQLSDRQRSVLALLVDGLGNREIAVRLGCTVGTIENHVTKLLKRAAVDNRAALTATFWKTQRR